MNPVSGETPQKVVRGDSASESIAQSRGEDNNSLKQVLDGLHNNGRITQADVQAMSTEEINALNKKEVQSLVSLLPREHQEALMPYLLSLKQVQLAVDKEVRARVGDEWLDILPGRTISREEYDGIIEKVSLDPVSNRGSIQNHDNGNKIVRFHRVAVAYSGPSTPMDKPDDATNPSNWIDKVKDGANQVVENLKSAWASLRVGRPYVKQDDDLLKSVTDLVLQGKSLLVIGQPGSGKTTLSRAIAATVAEKLNVVMVEKDGNNEMAGNGVAPHPVLGKVLRMSIEPGKTYEQTLEEADKNHGPDSIFTDEIKTDKHAQTLSSSIADGVSVVATVHGKSITSVLQNPALDALTGGTQTMTVGDDIAKKRGGSKQVTELRHTPPIDAVVVMRDKNTIFVYKDYRKAVDDLLKGQMPKPDVYPLNRQEPFDYQKETGEEPGIFSRSGAIQGGVSANGQTPQVQSKMPPCVSPRQEQAVLDKKQAIPSIQSRETSASVTQPPQETKKQRIARIKEEKKQANIAANERRRLANMAARQGNRSNPSKTSKK